MISNKELIAEIRKPGKVSVPVLMSADVERIIAEKSDLIALLSDLAPDDPAPWIVVSIERGVRNLDIQD